MSDITIPLERPTLTDEEKDAVLRFLDMFGQDHMQIVLLETIASLYPRSGDTPVRLVQLVNDALWIDSLGLTSGDRVQYVLNNAPAFYLLVKWARTFDKEVFPEQYIPAKELVRKCLDIYRFILDNGDPAKYKLHLPTKLLTH